MWVSVWKWRLFNTFSHWVSLELTFAFTCASEECLGSSQREHNWKTLLKKYALLRPKLKRRQHPLHDIVCCFHFYFSPFYFLYMILTVVSHHIACSFTQCLTLFKVVFSSIIFLHFSLNHLLWLDCSITLHLRDVLGVLAFFLSIFLPSLLVQKENW